jgi:hypothetical protein
VKRRREDRKESGVWGLRAKPDLLEVRAFFRGQKVGDVDNQRRF